jgi:hypothetical protein
MKDFNAERDKRHQEREREFGEKPFTFGRLGGVPAQFYVRANVGYLGVKRVAALSESSTGGETFEAIEESVFSMIDPRDNALERFRQVIALDNPDPITFDDLVELQNWLLTEQTALPPTEQQPSAPSSTDSGPSSTETSSSELGEASTI